MPRSWFLPLLILNVAVAIGVMPAPVGAEPPVLLGLYTDGPLQTATYQIQDVDTWVAPTGRRLTIAGDFMDLEFPNPSYNVPAELNAAWNAGYIPFVNLMANRTSAQIASGQIDAAISTWAGHFATWASGGKRAFLAPLAEMNGNWTPYYGKPADFIAAYRRIRARFAAALQAKGVPASAISWVFVPNGWGAPGDEFEKFYPGHEDADVVGFSSYNYGGCPEAAPWLKWETFDTVFKPYLDRMSVMAPGKPLFIAQTGVLDKPVNGVGNKDEWLRDSYTRLAAYPHLRGILYFNVVLPYQPNLPNCPNPDFRLRIPGTTKWQGFKDALANPQSNFGYWAPGSAEIASIVFAPTVPRVFADVYPIHPFAKEDGEVDYSPWIHTLAAKGVVAECSPNAALFCPTDVVTRAQMAVFLERGIRGGGYTPPPATGLVFADVPLGYPSAAWIEQLSRDAITGGCATNPPLYCPDSGVTRGQMAVFLLRAKYGASYWPPPATGIMFTDVPATTWYAPWVEKLAADGITSGCGGGKYCPDASILRQQMAVFLVRAFGLAPGL